MSTVMEFNGDSVRLFKSDAYVRPKKNRRVRCLVCIAEFESDEMMRDSASGLWVCPHCLKGWGYGHEIVPIERKG